MKADKYVNTLIAIIVLIVIMHEMVMKITIPKCFEITSADIIFIIIAREEVVKVMVLN